MTLRLTDAWIPDPDILAVAPRRALALDPSNETHRIFGHGTMLAAIRGALWVQKPFSQVFSVIERGGGRMSRTRNFILA